MIKVFPKPTESFEHFLSRFLKLTKEDIQEFRAGQFYLKPSEERNIRRQRIKRLSLRKKLML